MPTTYGNAAMDPNPFLIKKYYIFESPISSNTPSSIKSLTDDSASLTGFTKMGPKNLFEIKDYLSIELNHLYADLILLKRCDDYGLSLNTTTSNTLPPRCATTFTNFNSTIIDGIKQSININPDVVKYHSVFENGISNIRYNDTAKKTLSQRVADLTQLLSDFSTILSSLSTQDIQNKYPQQYGEIMEMSKTNMELRNELEKKIHQLYGGNESRYGNSKLYLDSAVYSSVLWTILATTLLFYIFRKM
jgi:hypothetical protein